MPSKFLTVKRNFKNYVSLNSFLKDRISAKFDLKSTSSPCSENCLFYAKLMASCTWWSYLFIVKIGAKTRHYQPFTQRMCSKSILMVRLKSGFMNARHWDRDVTGCQENIKNIVNPINIYCLDTNCHLCILKGSIPGNQKVYVEENVFYIFI